MTVADAETVAVTVADLGFCVSKKGQLAVTITLASVPYAHHSTTSLTTSAVRSLKASAL